MMTLITTILISAIIITLIHGYSTDNMVPFWTTSIFVNAFNCGSLLFTLIIAPFSIVTLIVTISSALLTWYSIHALDQAKAKQKGA